MFAAHEIAPVAGGRLLHEVADAEAVQHLPGEFLPGIVLAGRRDVGMGEHPVGRDGVAAEDVLTQRRHRLDLDGGEGRVAEIMAGIGDLDADGARVDVGGAGPE